MKHQPVLHEAARFIVPFLIVFALYVQVHGEETPGGGFQSGVIVAAVFILHTLLFGLESMRGILPMKQLVRIAAAGVLVYGGTGIAALLMGGHYLDYNALMPSAAAGQKFGITVVELGVGMTVFSVMLMLFLLFVEREQGHDGSGTGTH